MVDTTELLEVLLLVAVLVVSVEEVSAEVVLEAADSVVLVVEISAAVALEEAGKVSQYYFFVSSF
jgi:hypothetical protein